MSFGKPKKSVCLDDILTHISEEELLYHYLNITALPVLVNSPLRSDKNASLSIFKTSEGSILFKDFGSLKSYNIFTFLSELWHLSIEDTLLKILNELNSIAKSCVKLNKKHYNVGISKTTDIQCKIREWRDYDIEFWESYGISLDWLKFGDVYPISNVFICKEDITYRFAAEKYAYAYVERKDGLVTLKIYQPKSLTRKWINKSDSSVWDLWTKLPQSGDKLFITSSRKDALCLWENTGIPSVSLQGEGYIPKEKVLNELKDRFNNIYIFFDNDYDKSNNPGLAYAKQLSEMFNIPYIIIPSMYKAKDPSDFVKLYGRDKLKVLIKELI